MGSSFKCFYCFNYFSELQNLFKHTSQHEIPDKKVLLETYIYKGKRAILVDIAKLKCRICNNESEYPNLNAIKEHLNIEHGKDFFPATNGMIEFNMDLEDGMFKCQICKQDFHEFNLLNTHMNAHFTRVVCENCGEGFINQHLYLKHKESHLKDKFCCKLCDKLFYKRSQLKYHMSIVHKGKERAKSTKCPHCSLTFKEYYSKISHLKKAHGIFKNFQCHICKMEFNTRRAVTAHVTREHTEKFKCKECFKCFSIESKLKQHVLGHSKEKNFICPVCNNGYVHNRTLKAHMKTHDSPSTPFKIVCALCGTGFCAKKDYTKHMKLWHFFGEADEYESDENLYFLL